MGVGGRGIAGVPGKSEAPTFPGDLGDCKLLGVAPGGGMVLPPGDGEALFSGVGLRRGAVGSIGDGWLTEELPGAGDEGVTPGANGDA